MSQRQVVLHETPMEMKAARSVCVEANGDFTRLDRDQLLKDIVNVTKGYYVLIDQLTPVFAARR